MQVKVYGIQLTESLVNQMIVTECEARVRLEDNFRLIAEEFIPIHDGNGMIMVHIENEQLAYTMHLLSNGEWLIGEFDERNKPDPKMLAFGFVKVNLH